ncbi:MAG: hypothetical protein MZV63_66570 [Marinilabiliales bacterium]|nr:hypothetical protein [Marinilabiliales bacterium]
MWRIGLRATPFRRLAMKPIARRVRTARIAAPLPPSPSPAPSSPSRPTRRPGRRLGHGRQDPRGRPAALAGHGHRRLHDRRPRRSPDAVRGHDAGPGLGQDQDGGARPRERRHRAVHGLRRRLGQRVLLAPHARAGVPADDGLPARLHLGHEGQGRRRRPSSPRTSRRRRTSTATGASSRARSCSRRRPWRSTWPP